MEQGEKQSTKHKLAELEKYFLIFEFSHYS